jgi:hypothetical protein
MDLGVKHILRGTDSARFWSKVAVNADSGCWEWTSSKDADGYGVFTLWPKQVRAHRLAWLVFTGTWPAGLCVCHRCDNRKCVRPSHLFLGTVADNQRDMAEKKRSVHGVRNRHVKLTPDQVREIRAGSESNRALATRFGCTPENIHAIRSGKTWKHV